MALRINVTSVMVDDQRKALEFYTGADGPGARDGGDLRRHVREPDSDRQPGLSSPAYA